MPLTDLTHAPIINVPLEGTKLTDLLHELANTSSAQDVASDTAWNAFILRERQRYQALVEMFDPYQPLAATLATELGDQLNAAYPGQIGEGERPGIAVQTVVSILNNRRVDAAGALRLLSDTGWTARLRTEIAEGRLSPARGPEQLPPAKYDEMAQVLLGPDHAKPEAAAHIIFSALGQRAGHQALAATFAPGSVSTQRFIAELQSRCPADDPAALAAFGHRWMRLREERAALTVDANDPASPMVQSAIAEGEQRRLGQGAHGMPEPSPLHEASTVIPQPALTARTTLLGRLRQTVSHWMGWRQDATAIER